MVSRAPRSGTTLKQAHDLGRGFSCGGRSWPKCPDLATFCGPQFLDKDSTLDSVVDSVSFSVVAKSPKEMICKGGIYHSGLRFELRKGFRCRSPHVSSHSATITQARSFSSTRRASSSTITGGSGILWARLMRA